MSVTPMHPKTDVHDKNHVPVILVVEDEVLLRVAVADFLQDFGFKVLQAGTADEALEIFNQRVLHIDLVFTDVRMPGSLDGFGLAKWIRDNRAGTPVILASGDSGRTNPREELIAGEPFFPKPYDFYLLVKHMKQMIDARKSCTA